VRRDELVSKDGGERTAEGKGISFFTRYQPDHVLDPCTDDDLFWILIS
jgi:hypothetical protein